MGHKRRYIKPQSVKELENEVFRQKKEANPNFPYPVKPKFRDDTSNSLTGCVIAWIEINGGQAERINSTGRQVNTNGRQKWIKGTGTTGTADVSATIEGRSVKIEVKCDATGDRNQSKEQIEYQEAIEKAGGVYVIARNFSQFQKWHKEFTNGKQR